MTGVAVITIDSMHPRWALDRDESDIDAPTLEGCRRGDPAALRVFIARTQHEVFAFLSRTLGPGHPIEELAQEVFFRACRALPRFDGGGVARLSTWVLAIAHHVPIDHLRRRRVAAGPMMSDADAVEPGTPETELRRIEIWRAVERAARTPPSDHRAVLVLAEYHGLDTKQIASVLGIREITARTRLFRARSRMRIALRSTSEDL